MSENADEERPENVLHRDLEELRRRLAASRADDKVRREESERLRVELAELLARIRRGR